MIINFTHDISVEKKRIIQITKTTQKQYTTEATGPQMCQKF